VLGWSMGGTIAQALAVRHPRQVRRLILCATFPGDGKAVRPSRRELDEFDLALLFPAGHTAAENAFLAGISSYPTAPDVTTATAAAQRHALDLWRAGTRPGR
jgi:pimeloyl-ACP methyl ester carboxylesterase